MATYFAAAPRGVEPVLASELAALGAAAIEPDHGGVHFEGDKALLYRANLHLRTATRVLLTVKRFSAAHREMLYDQVRRIRWEEHLTPAMTFAVDCKIAVQRETAHAAPVARPGRGTPLSNEHYVALKIKDSIVDQIRHFKGKRPDIDTKDPDLRIHAYLNGSRCTLSLDASGSSLHERGYRLRDTGAPLKEALAAAIVDLTGWDPRTPFVDPMCGSGTLCIEAAMKAMNIPPGWRRQAFGFMKWRDFDHALWQDVLAGARARILLKPPAPILGFDKDERAIAASDGNAKAAKLHGGVTFARRSVEALEPAGDAPGVVVMNPPYGKRIADDKGLQELYRSIGDTLKHRMKGWTAFIFTGNLEMAKYIGLQTSRRIPLHNGPIECRLLKYTLY
jgi:putative N6-adenine-specific DNA methylase